MQDDKLNPVNMFEDAKKEAQDAHARKIEIINLKHKNRMELANRISEAEVSEEARELMKLDKNLTYREAVLEIRSVMNAYKKAMAVENKETESEEQKEKEWQKVWQKAWQKAWHEREQEWQKAWQKREQEWQEECQKVWQKAWQEREQEWQEECQKAQQPPKKI